MANTGVDLQLRYIYDGDPIHAGASTGSGPGGLRQEQPGLRQTRDDAATGPPPPCITRTLGAWALFGSEPMKFFVTGAYTAVDSNIDFYNQEAVLGMAGICVPLEVVP